MLCWEKSSECGFEEVILDEVPKSAVDMNIMVSNLDKNTYMATLYMLIIKGFLSVVRMDFCGYSCYYEYAFGR